jgi:hypothetical protein
VARFRASLAARGTGYYHRALDEYCDELRAAGRFQDGGGWQKITVDPADDPTLMRLCSAAAAEALTRVRGEIRQGAELQRRHEGRAYAKGVVARCEAARADELRLRLHRLRLRAALIDRGLT